MAKAQEEWRSCAEWLVKCKIIADNHKFTDPTAQVFDLAQVLRDGVLICHLLNRLHPGAIDQKDFSQRPQMSQFLCLKNIRVFLSTCQSTFGMRDQDLFEPSHLFDVSDFGRVIQTLSKLSNTPVAKKSGIEGFQVNNTSNDRDSDGIYGRLPDLAEDAGLDEEPYDLDNDDDNYEDIYGNLIDIVNQFTPKLGGAVEPKTKRDMCIKELVETEKNYVEGALTMVCDNFTRTLRSIISPADYAVIFFGIEELQKIHTGFYSDLSKACAQQRDTTKPGSISISDCFVKWKEKFLIYGEFCSNLPKAQEFVDKVQKDPLVLATIVDCQMKANQNKFRLRDLLSVPMQRVLKYHLLLKELIKQTEKNHPDRKSLERALEEMQDLSLYVNEVKRDNEVLQLISEIENSIVDLKMPQDTHLKDYGRLLKDGELKVRPHDDNKWRSRYVFLFDKVLLMCKSRGETYNFKSALVLSQYKIEKQTAQKNLFPFMLVEKGQKTVFTVFAKTEEMRRKWIESIEMAQDNTMPAGARDNDHEFIMASFDEPTICDVCRKLLRGVFYQGYRCQNTLMVVHKECIVKARNQGPPVVPPRPEPGPPSKRNAIGRVKANYAYNGRPLPDSGRQVLQFAIDDAFDLISDSDEHWWEGRFKGQEGWFPKEYVKETQRSVRGPQYEHSTVQFDHPPPRPPSDITTSYVNIPKSDNMDVFQWYAGPMSRDTATIKLDSHSSSTFLIRESVQDTRRGMYALSIKFGSEVKHIRIQKSGDGGYYLAEVKVFRSIPEMVEHYQNNSLDKSFPGLQTRLTIPYKDAVRMAARQPRPAHVPNADPVVTEESLGHCRAVFDYAATQTNQLSLSKGDLITILSKAGDFRGWWKGQLRGKTGYFPSAYVEEEEDASMMA